MWLWLLMWSTLAQAQPSPGFGGVSLSSGTPEAEFESCLSKSGCAGRFYRFLAQATLEQGFAMEGASVATSAVVNRHTGFVAGGLLHTFPFSSPRENLAGKTENTQFSPVFPKLLVGKLFDQGDTHWGLGATLLPPIPVGGAAALNIGLDGSYAKTLSDGRTRMGVDVDFSFVRATAPVTASDEHMESPEEDGLKTEVYEANCDPDVGCIDVFKVANLAVKAGMSWMLGERFMPYTQVGISFTNEWLYVDYDGTRWTHFGIQPTLSAGGAWTPSESIFLSLGGSLGLQQSNQNPADHPGVFAKLTGSAATRF
jgi:opacity protein-like surface antigen